VVLTLRRILRVVLAEKAEALPATGYILPHLRIRKTSEVLS